MLPVTLQVQPSPATSCKLTGSSRPAERLSDIPPKNSCVRSLHMALTCEHATTAEGPGGTRSSCTIPPPPNSASITSALWSAHSCERACTPSSSACTSSVVPEPLIAAVSSRMRSGRRACCKQRISSAATLVASS